MAIEIVKTEYGYVKGHRAGNQKITVFKGIPYAQPPVGALRWRPPMPCSGWDGVLDAGEYAKIPIQPPRPKGTFYQKLFFPVDLERSEDCLYLNIWTPANSAEEKLPVAFWIYGGGYTTGYANKIEFDGEAFAKRGCIFVSFNYRVGVLGFMAHPELSAESPHHVSGNYGLMDQIAALRWVRQNIAAFGGDPERITIFGQSAGAMSCMNLVNTPFTEGMIKRAICESCGGLSVNLYKQNSDTLEEAERKGEEILKVLGVGSIAEARTLDAGYIADRAAQDPRFAFATLFPVADGYLLPLDAVESFMQNKHQKIDYMVGSTANEGYGFNVGRPYDPKAFQEEAQINYEDQAQNFLTAVGYEENGTARPTDTFGDSMTAAGLAWNELELLRCGQTAYQYYFTKTVKGEESGSFHSAEHAYIFQTLERFDLPYDGSDYDLSNTMCDYWTNFIKSGDPNAEGLPRWERYGTGEEKVMELGAHVGMIKAPDSPGIRFARDYMVELAKMRQ